MVANADPEKREKKGQKIKGKAIQGFLNIWSSSSPLSTANMGQRDPLTCSVVAVFLCWIQSEVSRAGASGLCVYVLCGNKVYQTSLENLTS